MRRNNCDESNLSTARIKDTINSFFSKSISNQKKSEVLYSIYTDYESIHTSNYGCFFWEEVLLFKKLNSKLQTFKILAPNYIQFTTEKVNFLKQ